MLLMIPKGYESAAPDAMPDPDHVAKMMEYNDAMQKAGILIALDGLFPPATGARITFNGGRPCVTHGPFSGAQEMLGGYWMIEAASKQEAIDWASRCPALDDEMIEVRRVFEMADFPPELQKAAEKLKV